MLGPPVLPKDSVGTASGLLAWCLLPGVFRGQRQQSPQAAHALAVTLPVTLTSQETAPSVGMAGLCADMNAIVFPDPG